jgi:nucleoside-diphosphate-sugar epimerase
VAEIYLKAAKTKTVQSNILNVGTGKKTTVHDLIQLICNKLPNILYTVDGQTPGDQSGIFADCSRLERQLGYNNYTNLNDGLDMFITWALKDRFIENSS